MENRQFPYENGKLQARKEQLYSKILNYCVTPKEIKEIAALLGVNETTTRDYIRALIKDGRIIRIALNGKDGIYQTSGE
jgi:predicted transcriptional regulator